MAKIELPESWAGVAEPLRALMAEFEREAQADSTGPADLAAVSARWERVSDAVRAAVRAQIADTQAARQAGADRGRPGRPRGREREPNRWPRGADRRVAGAKFRGGRLGTAPRGSAP